MAVIDQLGTFVGVSGNNFDCLATATGPYGLVVSQGQAVILDPTGKQRAFDAPQIHVGRLGVVAGELVVYHTAFLGYAPGTQTDNPDRPWRRLHTGILCGAQTGATATGTTAPQPPGGTVSAPVDLGPILAALAALNAKVDALQTDVVGRLKAHDERMTALLNAVQHGVDGLPDAIVGEVPAGDHFGLDPRAQFGNRWQELFAYVLTARQDFWQVVIERFFEGALNAQKEGLNPATGKYDLPKQP